MQFIDLKTQYERIQGNVNERVLKVLGSQRYIMGPEVAEVEKRLADFAGTKYAITCSSGTDALVIPLLSFSLKPDDAVFVPAFTFFASAESITLAGGTPVFVDVDPDTFNMDPNSLTAAISRVKKEARLKPKGIVAVDLFGQPADYEKINKIAKDNNLFVLEDAAQSFGSSQDGKRAGSLAMVAATSFFPAKPLGCYGDGGAIFTNDDDMADLLTSIRVHGQGIDKYDNVRLGINGRFDTIQAAVILAKLDIFQDEIESRNHVADSYTELLQNCIKTPKVEDGNISVWAQYTLTAKDEDERSRIIDACKASGIPTAVYYPIPIHLSTAYKGLGYAPGDLPVTENLSKRVFSLPMHPYLPENDIEKIADVVKGAI